MLPPKPETLVEPLVAAAERAGGVIMAIYEGDFAVRAKADDSPVTAADEAAERVILAALAELTPGIPVIAEEEVAAGRIPEIGDGPFWLVDPLDGTKEFVKRNGEFTVNIGLVTDGGPVLGVVHAPALGLTWTGAGPGTATERRRGEPPRRIAVRPPPAEGLTVMSSRSHRSPEQFAAFVSRFRIAARLDSGSSLKLCKVAAGEADLYPRFGPTSEWDTAAAHAVVLAAGGQVTDMEGRPLRYRKPRFLNPHFVVWGGLAPEGVSAL